ncbi:MAG: hypothetical protein EXS64_11100 [Candidatus Latescibacteria bacterium]|nr:hypothetical protein [Candidatus Latescibacterota bacterium]
MTRMLARLGAVAVLVWGTLAQAQTKSPDFNGSGQVDFGDFFLFADVFGAQQGGTKFNAKFDLDGNGKVDFDDFFLFAKDFGKTFVPQTSQNDLRSQWSHGTCTGQGTVRFTASPMGVEDISAIIPMGLMVDAHVTPIDHQYYVPKDVSAGRYRYDVRVPADGFIVHIQRRTVFVGDVSDPNRTTDDFRLVIEHSCTFWTYYDLMTQLDQTILDQTGGGPSKMGPPTLTRIPVKAGQVIGKVGGQTLDVGVVNGEVTLPGFVVPSHYDREPWKVHTVDPFDAFDEPLKSQLLTLNPRKALPRGGKIDYDIDGRLVGNWFRENTNAYAGAAGDSRYWSGHLSIVYHAIDTSKVTVSLGDFNGRSRQFWVKGNAPDPATVTASSGPVKYELVQIGIGSSGQTFPGISTAVQGVVLLQMVEDRRLKVEIFPDKTAADVAGFTSAALIYER